MRIHRYHNDRIILINARCEDAIPRLRIQDGIKMVFADFPYSTTQNVWDMPIDLKAVWKLLYAACVPNAAYVCTAATPFHIVLGASNISDFKYDWIWRKQRGTGHLNAKKQPMRQHEHILTFYRSQPTYNPQMRAGEAYTREKAKRRQSSTNYGADSIDDIITVSSGARYPLTVLDFDQCSERLHPTQKPIDLLEYLIRTYTNEGEWILDPTMGVGSTAIAALNTNRRCIGIDSDTTEGYFETAIKRVIGEL